MGARCWPQSVQRSSPVHPLKKERKREKILIEHSKKKNLEKFRRKKDEELACGGANLHNLSSFAATRKEFGLCGENKIVLFFTEVIPLSQLKQSAKSVAPRRSLDEGHRRIGS